MDRAIGPLPRERRRPRAGLRRARRYGRASANASDMSWVTRITVVPSCRWIRRNSRWSSRRVTGSSAPNGSSIRRIGGSTARALATPTRWRWPPDSSEGQRDAKTRGRQADQIEQLVRAGASAIGRPALQTRHQADVLFDGHVRKQPDVLQHVADAAPQPNPVPLAGVATFDPNRAGGRQDQAIRPA